MREAFGNNYALTLLLEHVIADRFGRAHAFLDVSRLEDVALGVASIGGPNACVAVGLQLDADLNCIALRFGRAGLSIMCLVQRAFEVLDVMPNLVRNHIRHCEVARRPKALRQLVEEGRVEINGLVVGAVERAIAAWPMPQAVCVPPV